MMPKGSLVFIIVLAIIQVINGQNNPNVTIQNATVTLGEDATINCFYTIYGERTLLAVHCYSSNSIGDEGDLLVSSSIGSNPNGRYSVDVSQAGVATLNIVNTLKSDDGFYQCTIVDSVGISGNHFGSLTVQFIENVMISVKNSTVTEGNDVTIECSVSATPVPTITLYKDEQFITNETTEAFIHKISNVTMSDRGNYRCEAINIVGTRTSPTELLNVQYPPKIVIHGSDNGTKTVLPGEMVVITLEVLANPDDDIKYQWTINPEIEGTVTNSSTLEFKAGEVGTVYNVTVTATNSIGSTTESVMVIVADPCADDPCENGGTCIVVDGGYICNCTNDFSGLNCSYCIYKDGCCQDEGDIYNYGNGTCGCICGECRQFNYTTNQCENIDYCASNPCEHNGTCIPAKCNFTCECMTDYSGSFCENFKIQSTPCSLSCQNGGTCQIVNDTEKCVCPTGFEGQYCQHNKTHIIENCVINIRPNTNPVKKGKSVDIECSSENSYPIPMITLFKDGKEYQNVTGTKLTYNIESMKKSNKGDYYCIATNIAGNRISETIKLKYKPNILAIILGTLGGCVVLVGISFGGYRVYKSQNSKKPPKDPTSDPVVPQGDVEMKQPDSNSDLKRYAASGGDLYTQVSIKDKKKKPDSDNGSNKPTAVDV
ncbi:uncharacterized protein LOC117105481 isoform X2 [Anneissia japonica]|uniref:uncharacterized protein LOC117105481 isoform X2 n=1 Tax=Anneissia japonica TaxID=1529436 RepID=UPI0014259356|nr:uncharacterized protein LOC117105481 isoform X2 [Anneissia japonica]